MFYRLYASYNTKTSERSPDVFEFARNSVFAIRPRKQVKIVCALRKKLLEFKLKESVLFFFVVAISYTASVCCVFSVLLQIAWQCPFKTDARACTLVYKTKANVARVLHNNRAHRHQVKCKPRLVIELLSKHRTILRYPSFLYQAEDNFLFL